MIVGWTVLSTDRKRALRLGWRGHSDRWITLNLEQLVDFSNAVLYVRERGAIEAAEEVGGVVVPVEINGL